MLPQKSATYALLRLLYFHYAPMSVPYQHRHFLLRTNTELISMKFAGGGVVTTTTNRWSDYIFGDIVPGTRKQDTTEKLESTSNWCCHVTNNVTVSQFIQHAAAAVLASPLHTCNGEGIVWPRAVFSSLGFNYVVSYIVIVICNVYAYRVTNLACPKCLNREDLVESNIRSTIFRVKFGPSWPNLDLRSVFLLCVQLCNFIMHLSLTC